MATSSRPLLKRICTTMELVWHRAELRTHDHPGLAAAAKSGEKVVPIVVIDPIIFDRPETTPRRQAWFLENVRALRESYRELGSDLMVREGVPHEVLGKFASEHRIQKLHYIKNHTPYAKKRDGEVQKAMAAEGVEVCTYDGQYTQPPGAILSKSGTPYQVFGPYGKAWKAAKMPELAERPKKLPKFPTSYGIGEIRKVKSDIDLPPSGETHALKQLDEFLENAEANYPTSRNYPAEKPSTSLLSMYFNIGVLGPRVAVDRAHNKKWKTELAWWDFNAEVLDRCPEGATEEFHEKWRGFPWRDAKSEVEKWTQGETGYPMVDAGMRQLQRTGFMHNRARMITASFLTKHLLIDWRIGESIFRGLLLCGDSAQNIGNWQWVAGSGYDASPYFRVFNPVTQGEKFDPDGDYVRKWVPELAEIEGKAIHRPWKLKGKKKPDYPERLIGLSEGRDRFLETAKSFLNKTKDKD